ncbi:hypothetical protein [Vagococcus bubulae]|uniref:DUF2187 domain-containing protein n=1 Tax=Vagococcus bubulae TaxID=1977868 RepID=A0A429ZDY2_9ENTE|nr:hypothetical protein [Vagococcus bubulae]RST91907.1 hypothetical protein CBF36_09285 [Vagococcus bubulae]
MSKTLVSIGSIIEYPTVHQEKVVGRVEQILKNTIIIRDKFKNTHLVLIKTVEKSGVSVDEETYIYKNRYSKN